MGTPRDTRNYGISYGHIFNMYVYISLRVVYGVEM